MQFVVTLLVLVKFGEKENLGEKDIRNVTTLYRIVSQLRQKQVRMRRQL